MGFLFRALFYKLPDVDDVYSLEMIDCCKARVVGIENKMVKYKIIYNGVLSDEVFSRTRFNFHSIYI